MDIISASYEDDKIAWYENNGAADPSFSATTISTSADGATSVFVADIDNDGDLDIISASYEDDKIAWYENNGAADPSFSATTISTSADGATSVFVADIDNDGDLDIISSSNRDDKIAWYENNGAADPSFSATTISTGADGAQKVFVADIDNDGDMDIVSASENDDKIAWYENNGAADPSFSATTISTSADGARSVFVADIDNDGDLDIVSASEQDDKIAWYENNGAADPSFSATTISTSADGAYDIYVADIDKDGDMDIVSASRLDDTIALYVNNGAADPSFSSSDINNTTDGAIAVAVADVDRNGYNDILSASFDDDKIQWFENSFVQSGNTTFSSTSVSTSADGAHSVFAIDVDSDGDIDVLSASFSDNKIAWYENNGSESFTARTITTSAGSAQSVFAIDVDQDGDIDVLSASETDDKIAWYENDGSESFTARTITTSADEARSVFAIDVDSDSDIDILSASVNDDKIAWYENDGSESFTARTITTSADGAKGLFAIDVDSDGDIDVLSASQNDNKIAWYENNGSESFTARTITTSANGATAVFATDVDSDGDIDVLSASLNDDKIAWYENDGSESFTANDITTSADFAMSVFATDVDSDGDIDVLSASRNDDKIAWYENNGSESFTARTITTSADAAHSVFAIDVDQDGDIDVLSASGTDDKIAFYGQIADNTPPTIAITATDGSNAVADGATTNDNTLTVTFTSSEATSNFAASDITVTGGAISSFSATSSTVYTATFTPSAAGATTIDVAANTFTDAAGNNNIAASQFNWTYDNVVPTMTITATDGSNAVADGATTNDNTLTVTFTSSEATSNFAASDITVTGGAISNFSASSSTVYTATFTPIAAGATTIDVAANKFTDAVGNNNTAATQFNWTYDNVAPTIAITATDGSNAVADGATTNDDSLVVTFTASEATSDFAANDITVSGGTLSNFTATSSTVYTVTFKPSAAAPTTIDVAANKFTDAVGNNNTAASQFNWNYDNGAPAMTITATNGSSAVSDGATTNDNTLTVTFTSSEATSNFVASDITVSGGAISSFSAADTNSTVYTATFTPSAAGATTIDVAANTFTDAAGNNNTAASQFNWTYDNVVPTIAITATDGSSAVADESFTTDKLLVVTFTSSEATNNFTASDITVSGGAISNFSANSSTVYTATFTPSSAGATTIDVAANKFTDAVGNNNTAASQFNWRFDNVTFSPLRTHSAGSWTSDTSPMINSFDTLPADTNYWFFHGPSDYTMAQRNDAKGAHYEAGIASHIDSAYVNVSYDSDFKNEGSGSMQLDFSVHAVESWGGGYTMIRHLHPDKSDGYYDFSLYDTISFEYYALHDIDTDIQLRFIISEWSDFSNPSYTRTTSTDSLGGEYYYTFMNLNKGSWTTIDIPLKQNNNNFSNYDGFNLTGWAGVAGNSTLDLDKIKGFTFEFSSQNRSETTNRGTIFIDNFKLKNRNAKPSISNVADVTTTEDHSDSLNVTISAVDPNNANLTYSVSVSDTSSIGYHFTGNKFFYKSKPNWNGTAIITLTAANSTTSNSTSFNFTATAVNDKPQISAISNFTMNEDETKTLAISVVDPDSDNINISAISSNSSIPVSLASNNLSITPNQNYFGVATITLIASDGSLKDTLQFDVSVNSVNDAPTAVAQTIFMMEDIPSIIELSGTDVETPNNVTFKIAQLPNQGSINKVTLDSFPDSSQVLTFDGVDDHAIIPHHDDFNLNQGAIFSRLKIDDVRMNSYMRILSKKYMWNDSSGYELELNPSLGFISMTAGGENYARGAFSPSTNWISVGVSFNGEKARIYYNGKDVTLDSDIDSIQHNTNNIVIGKSINDQTQDSEEFKGSIDEIRVFGASLDSASMSSMHSDTTFNNTSSSWKDLIAYYKITSSSSNKLIDDLDKHHSNEFSGSNAPSLNTSSPFVVYSKGYSLYAADFLPSSNLVFYYPPKDSFNVNGYFESFQIKPYDGAIEGESAEIKLNIAGVNDLPTIDQLSELTIDEEKTTFLKLNASDPEQNTISYNAFSQISEIDTKIKSDTLIMTPKENYTGESIITVSAHDNISVSGDTTTFKLIVNNINDAPIIADIEDDNIDEDSMEKSVMLSASDVDSKDLIFYVSNDSSAVDAFITGNKLTYKPIADFFGNTVLQVSVSDSLLFDTTSFTLQIKNIQDTPRPFNWISSATDTINITKTNFQDSYNLQWSESIDVDKETVNYILYAGTGSSAKEIVYDTTSASVLIPYMAFLENTFEQIPMLPAATVRFSVKATDGIDTVNITGEDRVVYVNRYDYLSTDDIVAPTDFALHDNYPNPFNPTTQIRFDMPIMGDVRLTIYNMLGQKVKEYQMNGLPAGYHTLTWNATNNLGDPVSAGIYFYQLQTKTFTKTKRMVLLK